MICTESLKVDSVLQFCETILGYFKEADSEKDADKAALRAERLAMRAAFESAVLVALKPKVKASLKEFDEQLGQQFTSLIGPQLQAGADTAANDVRKLGNFILQARYCGHDLDYSHVHDRVTNREGRVHDKSRQRAVALVPIGPNPPPLYSPPLRRVPRRFPGLSEAGAPYTGAPTM